MLGIHPNLPTPPLDNLVILNYFFNGYLGLIDHEMDFEINLFFSPHKSGQTLRNFLIFHIQNARDY